MRRKKKGRKKEKIERCGREREKGRMEDGLRKK